MEDRFVVVAGRDVPMCPGDSRERMERVARHVEQVLSETDVRAQAHGREPDEIGRLMETMLRLGDETFLAQDENTRLRRDLTGVRAYVFELERKNDELNREISVLRMKLEKLEESAKEQANADE